MSYKSASCESCVVGQWGSILDRDERFFAAAGSRFRGACATGRAEWGPRTGGGEPDHEAAVARSQLAGWLDADRDQ